MHDDTTFAPTLVRRLSRRALRPGVTDPGQARAALTRHGDMTAGLPLAGLAARYVDPVPQHAGSTEPIVYARPAWSEPSGPSATGADAVGPGASVSAGSTPVVSARPATAPGEGPMASARPAVRTGADVGNAGDAVRNPARPGTGGSPMRSSSPSVSSPSVRGTPTIQRKVAAPPASPARPPARAGSGPSPTLRVPGPLAKRGGPGAPGPTPADPSGPTARAKPPVQGHGPVMAYLPSAKGRGPGAPVASRLATPSAHPGKDSEASVSASTTAPAVRPRPADDPHRVPHAPTAVPTVVAHRAPVSYSGPPGAEPLVAPAEVVSARQPQAQPVRTLSLATAGTTPHDRLSPGTAAGAPPRPVVQGPAHAVPPGHNGSGGFQDFQGSEGHTPRADHGTSQPPRPEAPQVDVAHITDQVHQRIVRRLAVEAERRGVRR
ncbi:MULTISPECIES: hypothetical protein [Streptomyces]|uniref:hypothetical protein n=1 Tax=Streptomyces TaxID=1883 RepID=UPI00224FE282|nr:MULTISPECIES: hypothetical protein [Streptomyces]MCX4910495.1 hypothetical protein [Streptomyces sp. NBC_00878]WSJ08616.1 hypothetical protein OG437_35800 [Streptomyces phaeochromogenes]